MNNTVICIVIIIAACAQSMDLLSVTTHTPNDPNEEDKEAENAQIDIVEPQVYEMRVDTNVTNRFAKTLVTSKVKNPNTVSKEAQFSVILPEKAYITKFVMEIDGEPFEAYIQEKEQAKTTYDTAVLQGQSAAHVINNARDSNRFTVNANIQPRGDAVFYLTYEELLARQLDQYEIVVNIQPGQPVQDLIIQVNINETRPLKFVRAPSLRSGNEILKNNDALNPNATITQLDNTTATVQFQPSVDRQQNYAKELGTEAKHGLAGQLVVQYDVERDPYGGEILLNEGFFVHFFAPPNMPQLLKYVIFILDTSISMEGQKLVQLKQAMSSILSELQPGDMFNLVDFSATARIWHVNNASEMVVDWTEWQENTTLPKAFKASPDNIKLAEQVLNKLEAFDATDLEGALKTGLYLADQNRDRTKQPIIIFLTDGEATMGETDNNAIIDKVTDLNFRQVPIYALSFGEGSDKKFLERLALKNSGFARHIYEGADVVMQLTEFYTIISSPLLKNITFKYISQVKDTTRTTFPIVFRGGELIVAGKVEPTDEVVSFAASVEAVGQSGVLVLQPDVGRAITSLERLWAYLTLRHLFEQRERAVNEVDKNSLKADIVKMALKYDFVSEFTSLVVVKPNETVAVEIEDASVVPVPVQVPRPKSFGVDTDLAPFIEFYEETAPYNLLINRLPWLSDKLSSNGSLETTNGTVELSLFSQKLHKPVVNCPLTPLNQTGVCQPLPSCPEVFGYLDNLEAFLRFSCQINSFTGICCVD